MGCVARDLEIQHRPAPAGGESSAAAGDDLGALWEQRESERGQDRVDPGREGEPGRVGLHQADIAPAACAYPAPGLGQHRVGQVDAGDPAPGPDRCLEEREVPPGAAADLDHGVPGVQPQRLQGLAAVGPLASSQQE